MKKPIFSKGYWIALALVVIVCGVFALLCLLKLLGTENAQANLDAFANRNFIFSMVILVSGLVLLLFANIAFLREQTKGFQFLITGLVLAGYILVNRTFLIDKSTKYASDLIVGYHRDLGDNLAPVFGYIFAGVALLLCISNWVLLSRRRKSQAEVAGETAPPPAAETTPTA